MTIPKDPRSVHSGASGTKQDGHQTRMPMIIIALGSSAVLQLRYCRAQLRKQLGTMLPHVLLLGIDTTAQPRNDRVRMLPDESFVNLAVGPGLQSRLRRALESVRRAAKMPAGAVDVAGSQGAGSIAAVAEFYLEEAWSWLMPKFHRVFDRFVGHNRGATAERANQHPWMRAHRMDVMAEGPVQVVLVASTAGGTAGILTDLRLLLEYTFSLLAIEPTFSLVLTLPALTDPRSLDARRRACNTSGRLQELADANAGRESVWQYADGQELRGVPSSNTIYLMPEPTLAKLEDHHQKVGELLFHMITPLGKTIEDRAVDMQPIYIERGDLGQPKFLSRLGTATLRATAYPDVVAFARATLGAGVTASAAASGKPWAARLLASSGLTQEALRSLRPRVEAPAVPRLAEAQESVFLANVERNLRQEGKARGLKAARATAGSLANFQHRVSETLAEPLGQFGPKAAAGISQALSREVHDLLVFAQTELAATTSKEAPARSGALGTRLEVVRRACEADAYASFLEEAVRGLRETVGWLDALDERCQRVAAVFQKLRVGFVEQRRDFNLQQPAKHAILDVPTLESLFAAALPKCMEEIRKMALEAIKDEGGADRLEDAIRARVERFAAGFRHLARVRDAIDVIGDGIEQKLKNLRAAAEPQTRLDPCWDPAAHCQRYTFVTLAPDDPLMSIIGQSGRTVCAAPCSTDETEIVIVSVDFGVEIGALTATVETCDAYLEGNADFPPFPDKRYQPLVNLVVPQPTEWYQYLAIPFHLCSGDGAVRVDETGMWFYNDVPLGRSHVEASRALRKRRNRDPRIPDYEKLGEEIERALRHGRTPNEIVETLKSIENAVSRHLAEEKGPLAQQLMRELAVCRALGAQFRDGIAHQDRYHRFYGPLTGNGHSGNGKLARELSTVEDGNAKPK